MYTIQQIAALKGRSLIGVRKWLAALQIQGAAKDGRKILYTEEDVAKIPTKRGFAKPVERRIIHRGPPTYRRIGDMYGNGSVKTP